MVFPHEHILLRFNGHFGASASGVVERWSAGIRFGLPGSAPAYDAAKLQTFVNAAATAAATFHGSVSTFAGTGAYFDQVSGAQIGVLGKYSPPGQLTVLSPNSPVNGTGAGGPHPWNTALVISLRTAIPRGRGSNGRVYWPACAATVDASTGRLSSAAVSSRLAQAKTFFDALNVAANTYSAGMKIIVASSVGGGLIATCTSIRSDQRLDSIERRENEPGPTWSVATLS